MMREKRWFPILYMFTVTAVFSSIVIGFARATASRVKVNQAVAFEKAVVSVLPGWVDQELSHGRAHEIFTERVTGATEATAGAYTTHAQDRIVAFALPFAGQGFWAPIRGVIGIDADKRTVTAVAIYEQNETPGLGAEIVKPAFGGQFKGKVLASEGRSIRIRRAGDALGPSDVHAVTGATQTCTRLEKMIHDAVIRWRNKLGQQ